MKQGKSLSELALELERQENAKRDFVADSRKLFMDVQDNKLEIDFGEKSESFDLNRNTHSQLASWADIPQKYYDRMPNDLRAVNVNHWFRQTPAKRMVRTLDGGARAFLSDRYRTLDNFDLAHAVLPILADVPDMNIVSSELTPNRMYIKALFPRIEGEIKKGDLVQSGVVISNSEVGKGSLRVEPLVYRLVCTNGMISGYSQKKYHVGRAGGVEDQAMEIFSDETLKADDRAFWLKVQDTVKASIDQVSFNKILEDMRRTTDMPITDDPVNVVEKVKRSFGLSEQERGGVLSYLISGGDLSAYGLLNALTRTSQDIDDYDRATDFERMGGKVIELSSNQWRDLAQAA